MEVGEILAVDNNVNIDMLMKKKELNEDSKYEVFVQEIYQTLIDNEEIKSTIVQHNVDLIGKSGCNHQIDVYWEYEVAGILHRVAIECKNYNSSNISIGKIRDFATVLSDVGNINGIFVCKNGYQSGAIKLATFYGINLKEARIPTDQDWTGRVKTIVFDINMIHSNIKNRNFILDNEWIKNNVSIPKDESLTYSVQGMADEIWILDEKGNQIKTIHQFDQELPQNWKEESNLEHLYQFENYYIMTNEFGKLKIAGIKYLYDVKVLNSQTTIDGSATAKAILKDVQTGTIKFFHNDGTVK